MIFLALLTKELRLRFRSERAIWVLVVYVLLLGAIGLITLANATANTSPYYNSVDPTGRILYYPLSIVQFFLIIFITPAFTATAINGEKERQTYDLLLASRLSGFALAGGKLLAGLMNVLLLIAAAIPLFSLVFFFGGVSLGQFLAMLVVFCVTVLLIGTVSLFLSTILRRPAVSTAVAYAVCLLWLGFPLLGVLLIARQTSTINTILTTLVNVHPLLALASVEPGFPWSPSGWLALPPWVVFACVNLFVTLFFFWVTTYLVRPKFLRLGKKPVFSSHAPPAAAHEKKKRIQGDTP
jgi:ABC-type transport system involved in multi-copper enzyme maturation permease subunit